VEDAFRSAQRRGESDATADPSRAADAFLGMLLTRATLLGDGAILDDNEQRAIIDFCVRAVSPAQRPRGGQ
jgi:hypothetical protein